MEALTELYLVVSLAIFAAMAVVWSKSNGLDAFIKIVLFAMTIAGAMICYNLLFA